MVYKGTEELAENKLILLYILYETGIPLSKNQITEIVLENCLMNYFTMQQFLGELVQAGLITCYEDMGRHYYRLESQGAGVLQLFAGRIPGRLMDSILEYLLAKGAVLRKEDRAEADYIMEDKDVYTICLRLIQKRTIVLDMKIKTSSRKDARKICENWNHHAKDLLEKMTKTLLENTGD
jgi:predicted transcriptional regulator